MKESVFFGPKSVIAFDTNSSSSVDIFDESDIEKQIFDSHIIIRNSSLTPKVKCSLWKPKDKSIYILCNLIEKFPYRDENYIKLSECVLNYKEKKIKFFSDKYICLCYGI